MGGVLVVEMSSSFSLISSRSFGYSSNRSAKPEQCVDIGKVGDVYHLVTDKTVTAVACCIDNDLVAKPPTVTMAVICPFVLHYSTTASK